MDLGLKLEDDNESLLPDANQFRRLTGKLLCLTHSRPDISYVICKLSQQISKSSNTHMQVIIRVLRYIKNAYAPDLFFTTNSNLKLTRFIDSCQGTCSKTKRSSTDFNLFLRTSHISWKYKKHSHKSYKLAEYKTLSNTSCEAH